MIKFFIDKLGVRVERFARAEFKTAAESLTRESMSDAQREQLEAYARTRARRIVFAEEHVHALALVARGARTLPPERRERLQVLLAKAIAAGAEFMSKQSAHLLEDLREYILDHFGFASVSLARCPKCRHASLPASFIMCFSTGGQSMHSARTLSVFR